MPHGSTVSMAFAPDRRSMVRGESGRRRLTLVRVQSGVAAGSRTRGERNVVAEWWALFETREQFQECCADDPVRFTDPLRFAQLKTEFEHVFEQHR